MFGPAQPQTDLCKVVKYGIGVHIWDIPFSTFSPTFMQVSNSTKSFSNGTLTVVFDQVGLISGIFYGLGTMCAKLSILSFYLRLSPHRKFRIMVYVVLAVVVLYCVVGSFEFLFACRPIARYWDFTITYGSCINWTIVYFTNGAVNTATDIAILALPIAMLRRLHIPRMQKIGLIAIFMTGIL